MISFTVSEIALLKDSLRPLTDSSVTRYVNRFGMAEWRFSVVLHRAHYQYEILEGIREYDRNLGPSDNVPLLSFLARLMLTMPLDEVVLHTDGSYPDETFCSEFVATVARWRLELGK